MKFTAFTILALMASSNLHAQGQSRLIDFGYKLIDKQQASSGQVLSAHNSLFSLSPPTSELSEDSNISLAISTLGQFIDGDSGLMATTYPGIAVRIFLNEAMLVNGAVSVPGPQFTIKAEMIKTGIVAPGRLEGHDLPSLEIKDRSGTTISVISFNILLDIPERTCSVADTVVDMGVHRVELLERAGQSEWVDFSIQLSDCPVTHVSEEYDIVSAELSYRISSPTGSELLELENSPEATAKGFGVELSDQHEQVLQLNTRIESGLSIGDRSTYSLPMKARFKKNGEQVEPGAARTQALIEIFYQ